jgi:hypothetical protein
MAQQTICPACGAPIVYSGEADEIRCPFCDAELQVVQEDGREVFRILSQPDPQKEVLSRPVEPANDVTNQPGGMRGSESVAQTVPVPLAGDKQTAPGYPGFISSEADSHAYSPERLRSETTADTVSVSDAPAFYRMHGPDVPVTGTVTPRSLPQWVPFVVAILIGLIVFFACAAGAWMMLSRIVRAS